MLFGRAEAEAGDGADRDDDLLLPAAVRPERDEAVARLREDRFERDRRAVAELELDLRLAALDIRREARDLLVDAFDEIVDRRLGRAGDPELRHRRGAYRPPAAR